MTDAAIVLTTVACEADARDLARALVGERFAACVQIVPITSVYRWDDAIEESGEVLLLCKIAPADFPMVEAAIRGRHTYAVPEIAMMEIAAGNGDYLSWLSAAVRRA